VLVRKNWREHLPWIVVIVAGSVLFAVLYLARVGQGSWESRPSGSNGVLFICGLLGGGICLFEFFLWPRKMWMRTWRIGRVKVWMRAHIWLGLFAVPLLLIHSGFYFNNLEATLLFALFLIVIASGVWGLIVQQFVPQKMLDDVPAETIFSQIDHLANLMIEDAERLVIATCGVSAAEQAEPARAVVSAREEEALLDEAIAGQHFTVGAVRTFGGMQGKVLQSQPAYEYVPNSEALRDFFNGSLADYLKRGRKSGSDLVVPSRAKSRFDELRVALPSAQRAVDAMENLAEQRRQFDRQARLHFWLHNWLWVHLPLSVALIVLMFVHIFMTLRWWWPS